MLASDTTENLAFLPAGLLPRLLIPKTSPTRYPDPPLTIVAPTATPLLTEILAVMF